MYANEPWFPQQHRPPLNVTMYIQKQKKCILCNSPSLACTYSISFIPGAFQFASTGEGGNHNIPNCYDRACTSGKMICLLIDSFHNNVDR